MSRLSLTARELTTVLIHCMMKQKVNNFVINRKMKKGRDLTATDIRRDL